MNSNALIFLAILWKAYLYLPYSIVPLVTMSNSLVYQYITSS